MARITKYSKGIQDGICKALKNGNTRRCACALVSISPDTFYRWLNEHRAFSDAIERAEAEAEDRYVTYIKDSSINSWQAAAWWLERRHHLDWRKRESHDIDLTSRSDSELAATVAGALEQLDASSETGGGRTGPTSDCEG